MKEINTDVIVSVTFMKFVFFRYTFIGILFIFIFNYSNYTLMRLQLNKLISLLHALHTYYANLWRRNIN